MDEEGERKRINRRRTSEEHAGKAGRQVSREWVLGNREMIESKPAHRTLNT